MLLWWWVRCGAQTSLCWVRQRLAALVSLVAVPQAELALAAVQDALAEAAVLASYYCCWWFELATQPCSTGLSLFQVLP